MKPIISFGEVLWDILPDGIFLGGAPANVAVNLARLGLNAHVVSAVGDDLLGLEALERLATAGVITRFVVHHGALPTGTVKVRTDRFGQPRYTIRESVAWDHIHIKERLATVVETSGAVIYGSLGLRSAHNRASLEQILDIPGPLKIFDFNLRPPFDDLEVIYPFARKADVLKMNEEELATLADIRITGTEHMSASLMREAAGIVMELSGCTRMVVTAGDNGAFYWDGGNEAHASALRLAVDSPVGAGDAFLAAFVYYLLGDLGITDKTLAACCGLAGYVANHTGAMPAFSIDTLVDDYGFIRQTG